MNTTTKELLFLSYSYLTDARITICLDKWGILRQRNLQLFQRNMIVILYKSYNTIICKYKLHVIFHVSEAKTGRRGCVWGLVVCPYWGRQHSIMKRVRNASNFERLFIQCPLYRYTNYTNFRSHVKMKQDSQVSGSHRYEFPFTWSRRELSKEQSRFFYDASVNH